MLSPTRRFAYPYLLLFFIVVKLILQYVVINPVYELHRDEFLHLDMANHLSAGYLSVPPFTAFVSLLIQWLGNGVFWVKFFPALFGVCTMIVIWRMVEILKGDWFAQVLAACAFICSAYTRLNTLYQPNSFDVLCWTLLFYCLMQYIQTMHYKWLLWMGVVLGIGFLNKYNILFLFIGMLPAVLLSPQKKLFVNKYLYWAGGIALLIALPNIIWQIRNGLPVIHHMKELTQYQLVNVSRLDFLQSQLIYLMGGGYLVVAALISFIFHRPYRPYRVIGWTYIFVLLLFIYLQAKSYYALGLYPVLLAFGSVYWERFFTQGWTRGLRVVWVLVIVVPFALVMDVVFPILLPESIAQKTDKFKSLGLLRWEDGKDHPMPQDFADMLGWKEMAAKTLLAYQGVPEADKPKTIVICDDYGQAGAINYYNRGKMPAVVSFNADYIYWFPKQDTITCIIKVGELDEKAKAISTTRVQVGEVTNPLCREVGTGVFVLTGISPEVPALLLEMRIKKAESYRSW
jgi:hypothetical protein